MSTMPTSTSAHRTTKFEMIRQGSIELVLYSEVVLPSGPSRTRNQARVGGPAEGKEKDRLDKQGRVEVELEKPERKVEGELGSDFSGLSIEEEGDRINETSIGAIGSDLVLQETRDSVPGDERYPQGAAQEDRTVWARYLGSDGRLRECAIEAIEDKDYAHFERIIIRPPRMSEIRHLINLRQTLSSDLEHNDLGQKEPSTAGDIKETQTERLKMFFERLNRGRGDGEVSVELGFWTGLANEVWQAIISLPRLKSVDLKQPGLPDTPVPVGTNALTKALGSAGQRYTPFFLLPKVEDEDDGATTDKKVVEGEVMMNDEKRALGRGLRRLSLENLSLIGTKNVINHLINLTDVIPASPLESLRINTLFFDSGLCAAVASIGSCAVLKELTIGTKGTKLLSTGFKEMVEGCTGLERLVLDGVEGRLVKTLWKDIEAYPEDLKEITIIIDESGTHHSWTMDHLATFAHVPFDQLTTLEVSRAVPPSAAMPFHPTQREGDQPRQTSKVHSMCHSQPIPNDIYQAILEKGKALIKLNLDWWEIDEERLARLIKTLVGLEELTVRLNFPLFRLVTVTAFPSTSHLSLLRVSLVPTEQLCWELDNTKVTGRTTKSAPLNKVAIKPEVTEAAFQGLPDELVTHLRAPDSTIPASKEIKKFARKLPRLERLEWTGREGKGSWNIVKPAADKKLGLLTVEFEHSAMDYTELWTEMTSDPIELPNIGDQEVTVSDVPPPATPSCATFSPGSSDLLAMSPMTMGSTIASEDPETPLARWTSSSIQSFPSLTGAWVKETREEGGWGGLGLENISPSPSTNTIANKNSRRENNNRPERNRTKPVVLAKAKSTPIAAELPEKPSLPRAETSAPTETPRRRGRRGGVGRSRGQGGGATTGGGKAEPPMSSTVPSENKIKAIVPTTNPDGWMTVAPRKVKEKEPVPATAGGETKTRRGRK